MRRFRNLNDQELQIQSQLLNQLKDKGNVLNEAIEEFNSQLEEAITELWGRVESAIEEYNEVASKANEFVGKIQEEQQQYFDGREEKWKEIDTGNSYQDWMNAWEIEVEEIALNSPSLEVEAVEIDHETFSDLPQKVY
jgi:uncharacterized coiled-coil DUF342 family protein